MKRRRPFFLAATLLTGISGCSQLAHCPPESPAPARDQSPAVSAPPPQYLSQSMAVASEPTSLPTELAGPQPVEAFIQRALAENRTVQAAYHNVQSLKHRIPQVTALDDPVASNVVFPIPSVAPQYFLMGYNPYNLTLAQQFPWFGTLRCGVKRPSATYRWLSRNWPPPSSTPWPPSSGPTAAFMRP